MKISELPQNIKKIALEKQIPVMWWKNLSFEEKFYKVIPWLKELGMNVTDKHPDSLTEEEIEQIYNKNKTK
jgi:hypothetical protein